MSYQAQRDTLVVEEAEIIAQRAFAADQYTLTLKAPQCALRAQPGMFAHLTCAPHLSMRRPLSIMRVSRDQGHVEFLYKAVGLGTTELSKRRPGEKISLLGPIGKPFNPIPDKPRCLLLGGGVGIPPMVFLADHLRKLPGDWQPVAFLGSEVPFPFSPRPSRLLLPGLPAQAIATLPLLEDWGILCRLASGQSLPGCYEGYVTDLARTYLDQLSSEEQGKTAIFACGPEPMLAATARLAQEYNLPCQIALEEFMACGVGGCAGCTVAVHTPTGLAMKRVCVDGPVFDANTIYPAAAAN